MVAILAFNLIEDKERRHRKVPRFLCALTN